MANQLRRLPSVDLVLRQPEAALLAERAGPAVATQAVRRVLERHRREVAAGAEAPTAAAIAAEALAADVPHLRHVVNATGVIVHTNLGRAPLAAEAIDAVARTAGGYANLELELETGGRGSRQDAIAPLVCELTGAEAALAVGNNAGALVLALSALAAGRDVVVSRGQLVEIGDGFRIPEILTATGARLVEVGATNRTTIRDYERALTPDTALLLRVHPSNFRVVGFTEEVGISDLAALGTAHGIPVLDDLGSGLLAPDPVLAGEPVARASVAAGASLVCFSADKLLGGPQAGVIAGTASLVERLRRHPLARALRIGKLAAAALEATLRLHRDPAAARASVPVLRMAHEPVDAVRARAARIAGACGGDVVETEARVGGGSLPTLGIPSAACALPDPRGEVAAALRAADPPVVARVEEGRVLLDARTIADREVDAVIAALHAVRP
jgi:L-seryl-tRNA(Ser) seleniumtransferase